MVTIFCVFSDAGKLFHLAVVFSSHMSSASEKVMSHPFWLNTKTWDFLLYVWQLLAEAGFNPIL